MNKHNRVIPGSVFEGGDTLPSKPTTDTPQQDMIKVLELDRIDNFSATLGLGHKGRDVCIMDLKARKIIVPLGKHEIIEYLGDDLFKVGKIGHLGIYDSAKNKMILEMMNLDNISYDEEDKIFWLNRYGETYEITLQELNSGSIHPEEIEIVFESFRKKRQAG